MKIKCRHGHFDIEESGPGEMSAFISRFNIGITPVGEKYTFEGLELAPRYSIKGKDLLGVTSIKNYEGEPWEVFEANEIVFDFSQGKVVSIDDVTQTTKVEQSGNLFLSPGLILPGSLTAEGKRVKDYLAWYSFSSARFLYSEVTYV